MNQKKIGQFLKTLRSEKEMTQEQLASVFNVSSRTISRWETGSNLPDISLLVEIADYYEVGVRELIEGERKSEMMTKEVEEVANKMADYANKEKSKMLKAVQIVGVLGIIIMVISIILQCVSFTPDVPGITSIVTAFFALLMLSFITLYVTGVLETIMRKKATLAKILIVGLLAITVFIIVRVLVVAGAVGILFMSFLTAKIDVHQDVENYSQYVHLHDYVNEIKIDFNEEIFPEKITEDMDVKEFQYTYYNPWDAQNVTYLTVQYDENEYQKEIERLNELGIEEYTGYYGVTDEPDGYDMVAMNSDDYKGFVYAIVPEKNDMRQVTYVSVVFCNYFLDLDIHKYLPDDYLLKGFDATQDNAYRKEQMRKIQ